MGVEHLGWGATMGTGEGGGGKALTMGHGGGAGCKAGHSLSGPNPKPLVSRVYWPRRSNRGTLAELLRTAASPQIFPRNQFHMTCPPKKRTSHTGASAPRHMQLPAIQIEFKPSTSPSSCVVRPAPAQPGPPPPPSARPLRHPCCTPACRTPAPQSPPPAGACKSAASGGALMRALGVHANLGSTRPRLFCQRGRGAHMQPSCAAAAARAPTRPYALQARPMPSHIARAPCHTCNGEAPGAYPQTCSCVHSNCTAQHMRAEGGPPHLHPRVLCP